MAKKLTEDQLNWVLSVDSTEAQQGIRKLTKENRELERANKERREEMIRLEMQGKKETEAYKNLSAVINENNAKLKSNRALISGLEDKIGTTGLTMAQLKKKAQDLQRQLDNTSQSTHPEEWGLLNTRLEEVRVRMDELKASGKKTEETLGDTIFSKGKMAAFWGNMYTKAVEWGVEAIATIKEFVSEGVKMAGMAQGVERAFIRISTPGMLDDLRQSTKGMVNDLQLMQSAVKANNFKIPLDELATLLRFAQQRAQETGESVEYLTDSIVTGIGRQSPLILDNLGISAKRLNEEVSKTGDFAKAVGVIVREELSKSGETIDTAADKAQQRAVLLQNIQMSIGQRIIGVVESAGSAWTSFLDVINRWVSIPTVEKLRDEQRETNILARSIMAAEGRTEARNLLIREMQQQYPSFLANLDTEKLTNEQLAERLREVNGEYENRIRVQVMNDKALQPLNEKQKNLIEEEIESIQTLNKLTETWGNKMSDSFKQAITSGDVLKMSSEDIRKEINAMNLGARKGVELVISSHISRLKKIPSELKDVEKEIKDTTKRISSFGNTDAPKPKAPTTEPLGLMEQYEEQRKKLLEDRLKATEDTVIKEKNIEINALDEKIAKLQQYGVEKEKTTKSKNNPYEKELKDIDMVIAEKKLRISESYADGLIMQDEYNNQLESLELESLNRKLSIYGTDAKERKQIEQQILDYKIRIMDKGFDDYTRNLKKEAEADRTQRQLKKEHYDKLNEQLQEFVDKQKEKLEQLEQEKKNSEEKWFGIAKSFASEVGQLLGESLTDSEKTFSESMYNILMLTLDTLRQVVTMAIAERTIKNIGTLGFIGIAKSAAEIALINVAFAAVKGLIKKPSTSGASSTYQAEKPTGSRVLTGKQSGGYMDVTREQDGKEYHAAVDPSQRGFIDKPTVIVGEGPTGHSKEWVASNAALENPTVRPFINVLNEAQEKGEIRTVDMNQMMRKRLAGFESGGSINTAKGINIPTSPAKTTEHPDSESIDPNLLRAILQKLDKLRAYVVYSDIEKAKDTLDKSKKIGGK